MIETLCPVCNGRMVSRQDKDGRRFWGCKAFPICRGTRNTDGEPRRDRSHLDDDDVSPSERMWRRRWE
jgi:ssDNA-binding Zn-finger/Zn-ribbon topoisomerase 1